MLNSTVDSIAVNPLGRHENNAIGFCREMIQTPHDGFNTIWSPSGEIRKIYISME
jgi:hypothetical protein